MSTVSPQSFNPAEANIGAQWVLFVKALKAALAAHRRRFGRSYRRTLEPWHAATIAQLGSDATRDEIERAWQRLPRADIQLALRKELEGVTELLLDLVDVPNLPPPPLDLPQRRTNTFWKLLRRKVGLAEGIKASGTLMETLEKLLDAVPWAKALLAIGQEAAAVIAND